MLCGPTASVGEQVSTPPVVRATAPLQRTVAPSVKVTLPSPAPGVAPLAEVTVAVKVTEPPTVLVAGPVSAVEVLLRAAKLLPDDVAPAETTTVGSGFVLVLA